MFLPAATADPGIHRRETSMSVVRRDLANAVRALSMDAVEKANSGHPGAPMGMADIAEVLWNDFLRHNPGNPAWANRDRFVLSNGHGSMLLYSLLHLSGYDLPMEEIKRFRQLHSMTPGHPEVGCAPGVETTSGPLGQGLANAVGMAIAIGTSHGAYKFTRPPTGDILAIDRIKEIHQRLPDTHLVMHGSFSVPQDWLAIINNYGGDMGQTYGVPLEEIQSGIRHGVRKVNIDTDLRMASTGAVRKFLAENPKDFDPRKFLMAATKAMKEICKARFEAFGCSGNAWRIQPLSLELMFRRYQAGELDPRLH